MQLRDPKRFYHTGEKAPLPHLLRRTRFTGSESVARAKRAIRRSAQIILAARDDLESHQRWLNRHRAVWTEQVTSFRRCLKTTRAIRALTRSAVGLLPVLIAILLIVEWGRRAMIATIPGSPQTVSLVVRPATSITVPKTRRNVESAALTPANVSGFKVADVPVPEPLSMPPQTIATMVLITNPVGFAPLEPRATTVQIGRLPNAAKPKAKIQIKRRLAVQESLRSSWWQTFPWIRVQ
jgi:hypothetical protein